MSQTKPFIKARGLIPELQNGDHLTRDEFERRYHAMPEVKKAELIEGVVYMPSPVRQTQHSGPNYKFINWLGHYSAFTPGVDGGDNGTIRLDLDNEPQPDGFLFIDPACGGQARIDEDDYIAGSPELVGEVSASSASYDLHTKLTVYRRNQYGSTWSGACSIEPSTGLSCAVRSTKNGLRMRRASFAAKFSRAYGLMPRLYLTETWPKFSRRCSKGWPLRIMRRS